MSETSDDDTVAEEGDEVDEVDEPRQPVVEPRGMVVVVKPKLILTAVAGLAVIAVLAVLFFQWRSAADEADDLKAESDDRQAASLVASDFAQTMLTLDTANPAGNLERLRSLATGNYQSRVDQVRNSVLSQPAPGQPQEQLKTTAQVDSVFIKDVSGDDASAVCLASWILATASQTAPPIQVYLELNLKREGGSWKVDDVPGIGTRRASTGATSTTTPAPETSTTATTAPG